MSHAYHAPRARADHRLHFSPLAAEGAACDFPCDVMGRVDMDALGERALTRYLYARAVIGREFALPVVQTCLDS